MACHQIILKLLEYRLQLLNIMSLSGHTEFAIDVTNQYSFITAGINKSGQSFAEMRFELTDEAGKLESIYCEDESMQETLNAKIEQEQWLGWWSPITIHPEFSDQIFRK